MQSNTTKEGNKQTNQSHEEEHKKREKRKKQINNKLPYEQTTSNTKKQKND